MFGNTAVYKVINKKNFVRKNRGYSDDNFRRKKKTEKKLLESDHVYSP